LQKPRHVSGFAIAAPQCRGSETIWRQDFLLIGRIWLAVPCLLPGHGDLSCGNTADDRSRWWRQIL